MIDTNTLTYEYCGADALDPFLQEWVHKWFAPERRGFPVDTRILFVFKAKRPKHLGQWRQPDIQRGSRIAARPSSVCQTPPWRVKPPIDTSDEGTWPVACHKPGEQEPYALFVLTECTQSTLEEDNGNLPNVPQDTELAVLWLDPSAAFSDETKN